MAFAFQAEYRELYPEPEDKESWEGVVYLWIDHTDQADSKR
jgi:hypothetical protein